MSADQEMSSNLSEEERKAAHKAAKKLRKQQRRAEREAQGTADTTPAELSEVEQPVTEEKKKDKKRKTTEQDDVKEDQEEDQDKQDKKRRKAEKKAQKLAKKQAAAASESTTTSVPVSVSTSQSQSTPESIATFLKTNNISHEPVSATSDFPPFLSFAQLPVDPLLRKGLAGFTTPTPIQSASFPITFGGRDVIGIAETGSGKTVAFGVPAISHILSLPASKKPPVSVLVVAPTRELASQTHDNIAKVASHVPGLKSLCVYGGVSKDDQKKFIRKEFPRIIVGTPGRLLDLANEGSLPLSSVSWIILDEADRMLDKGFENDIRSIISQCLPLPPSPLPSLPLPGTTLSSQPTSRRTSMFSATWPMSVRKLAADFMCQPVRITVGADELTANVRVEQSAIVLDDGREKERRLLDVLAKNGFGRAAGGKAGKSGEGKEREKCLVFALYKKEATRVYEFLQRQGYEVGCIQGDMTQDKRTKSLEDFKEGKVQLLVATDVAARGLDIPKVELVVNQTFPLTIEDYIHRIGRTGRAGRKGKSVTFFTEADKAHAGEFIRVLKDGNHEVPEGLYQWGTTIKKATHGSYGAHFRDDIKGTAKKIVF
ncbi:DEAD-domain-containing protein [Meredithblackwellia eburnea MCA 4105]